MKSRQELREMDYLPENKMYKYFTLFAVEAIIVGAAYD